MVFYLTSVPLSGESASAGLLCVVALSSPLWVWFFAGLPFKEQFYREVFLLLVLLFVPLLLWLVFSKGLPVGVVVLLIYPLLLWLGASRMGRLASGDFIVMTVELIAAVAFGAACVAAGSEDIRESLMLSPMILCFAGAIGGFRKRGNLGVAVANVVLQGLYVVLIYGGYCPH